MINRSGISQMTNHKVFLFEKKIMQYKIFCQSIKKMRDQNMTQTVAIMLKETQLAVL